MFSRDKYTVAIIGAGRIAKEIAIVASEIKDLETILMTTPHNLHNVRTIAEIVGTRRNSNAEVIEKRYDPAGFWDIRKESDIIIIALNNSADVNPNESIPQLEFLNPNLRMIQEVSKQLQGYEGAVLVVTNPTDILSYVVTQVSGLNPTQVMGFNHVDQTRGLSAFKLELPKYQTDPSIKGKSYVTFYACGGHFGGGRGAFKVIVDMQPGPNLRYFDDIMEVVRVAMDEFGKHEMDLEDTRSSTGIAMRECLDTILHNKKETRLDLSVYVSLGDQAPVFIGWPTQVEDYRAHPDRSELPWTDQDRNIFFRAYEKIGLELKRARIQNIEGSEPTPLGVIEKRKKESVLIPMQRFTEDVSVFANAGRDVLQWHISNPNEPQPLPLNLENAVTELAQGKIGDVDVLFAATRRKVIAYDIKSGKPIEVWDNPADRDAFPGIHALVYVPSQQAIYWARSDGRVLSARFGDSQLANEMQISGEMVKCGGLISTYGRAELVLGGDNVHFIDTQTGKIETMPNPIENSLIEQISVCGSQLYFINSGTHLITYDRDRSYGKFKTVNLNATPTALCVLDSGEKVAVSSSPKSVRIFNALNGLSQAQLMEYTRQNLFFRLCQVDVDYRHYLAAAEGHINGPNNPGDYAIHFFDLSRLNGLPELTLTGGTNGISALEVIKNASTNT